MKETQRHRYKYTEDCQVKTDESLQRNRDIYKETYKETCKDTVTNLDTKGKLKMDKETYGIIDRTKEMVPHSVSKKSKMSRKKQTDKSTEISSVNKEKNRQKYKQTDRKTDRKTD